MLTSSELNEYESLCRKANNSLYMTSQEIRRLQYLDTHYNGVSKLNYTGKNKLSSSITSSDSDSSFDFGSSSDSDSSFDFGSSSDSGSSFDGGGGSFDGGGSSSDW